MTRLPVLWRRQAGARRSKTANAIAKAVANLVFIVPPSDDAALSRRILPLSITFRQTCAGLSGAGDRKHIERVNGSPGIEGADRVRPCPARGKVGHYAALLPRAGPMRLCVLPLISVVAGLRRFF